MSVSDRMVQVYGATGQLEAELTPCVNPDGGTHFTPTKAFVVCSEDGFTSTVVRIDAVSFAIESQTSLALTDDAFTFLSSAARGTVLLAAGLNSGPDDTSYTTLFVLSLPDLEIKAQLPLGPDTYISTILPHGDRFYLLNTGSWRPKSRAADLLVYDIVANQLVEGLDMAAPSPLWGAFHGDDLWAFHNPFWGQTNDDPTRSISRINVRTGESSSWPLPDRWQGYDLDVIRGEIYLTSWQARTDKEDGLYRFDPATGALTLVRTLPDASTLLVSPLVP